MKRQGHTILETMVAAVLLAVAATVGVQMLLATASARQATETRRLATREAANVMERVMALAPDELTPQTVEQMKLSPRAQKALPGAKLTIRLDESTGDGPPATRVTVELTWKSHAGRAAPPLRLLAWRFHPEEARP